MNELFTKEKKLSEAMQSLQFDLRDHSYSHIALAIAQEAQLRREAIAELGERLSEIYELYEFDYTTTEQLSLPRFTRSIKRGKPICVFAYHLEELKKQHSEKYKQAIRALNSHREDIRSAKRAVVLWLTSETYADVVKHAQDFVDWRTSQAIFQLDRPLKKAEVTELSQLSLIQAQQLRQQAHRIEVALNRPNIKPAMEAELLKQLGFIRRQLGQTKESEQAIDRASRASIAIGDLEKLESLYRQHVVNQHSKLTLYSVKSDKPLAVELERVFVKLSMTKHEKRERFYFSRHGKKFEFDPTDPEEERVIPFEGLRPDERYEEKRITLSIGEALQKHKRLVVVGAPGAGKTTLLKYLAITFARKLHQEKLGIEEERIPLFLFLRDFSRFLDNQNIKGNLLAYKADLLPQFLFQYYDQTAKQLNLSEDFFKQLLSDGKCIVLMDGLDEVADLSKRGRITEAVSNIAQYYDNNQFIISSRPRGYEGEAKSRLSALCEDCLIRDFDEDDMAEFAKSWYKAVTYERLGVNEAATQKAEAQAEDLLRRIKAEPHVKALANNPLLLSILAMVHQRDMTLPQRRAELYDECTQMLLGYWDQTKGGEAARELATVGQSSRNEKRAILAPVALWFHERGEAGKDADSQDLQKAIAEQFVEIYGEDDRKAKTHAQEFLTIIDERAGLLVERETGTYAFAHLTFQEYLAARAIADRDDYIEYTLKHLHDTWWKEVILLEVGHLSDESSNLQRARKLTTKLIESLYKANSPLEDILKRDLLFAARAVADVGQLGMFESLRQEIADALKQLWQTTPFEMQREECEALFSYSAQTKLGELIVKNLVVLSENADEGVRRSAADALGNLGEAAATSEVISRLVALSEDANGNVRRSAAYALGNLGKTAATPEVISRLVALSEDGNAGVRRSAAEALGRMGEAAATPEVISRLVALIEDADGDVQYAAALALGNLGKTAVILEVISRLVALSEDADGNVRRSAAYALGNLGKTAATPEVISRLVALSEDGNAGVRRSAAEALGRMGEAAATPEVISRLVALIEDADGDVQYAAALALGNLGKTAVILEVISRLVALSEDGNAGVRRSAAEALGRMGEAAATPEVISRLVALIENADESVRYAAAAALGNLGKTAVILEVISRLVALSEDGNAGVRRSAAEALGRMGEAAATPEVISRLVALIENADESVRYAAADALGRMGEAAATPEVISRLVALIEDGDEFVQSSAADALGKMKIASLQPDLALRLITFWKDRLSDTNYLPPSYDRASDVAYREISKLVSQLPLSFKWEE